MIKFDKVEIIGYGSIKGPLIYHFLPGLNIIKAENGFGKTTIFNAWFWALTGETLKNKSSVNTWPHLQGNDYMGTKVTIDFKKGDSSYRVIRCNNYLGKVEGGKGANRLVVLKDGKVEPLKGIKITQSYINQLLGYSPDLFKNTIIFGQKLKRLIDEQGTNKKNILEEAFDLYFVSLAQEKAQNKKKKLLESILPLKSNMDKLESRLDGKRELLKQSLENEKEVLTQHQEEIKDLELEIKESRIEWELKSTLNNKNDIKDLRRQIYEKEKVIKKLQPSIDDYYKTMEELARLNQSESYINRDLVKLKFSIEKAEKSIKSGNIDTCPTCKQDLKGENQKNVIKHLKSDIKDRKMEYKELEFRLNTNKEKQRDRNTKIASLKKVIQQVDSHKVKLKELEKSLNTSTIAVSSVDQLFQAIEKLELNLQKLKNKTFKKKSPKIKRDIRLIKKEIKAIKPQYNNLNKDMEVTEWLIKDPLSNSGLKAYIFRDMIHKLNNRMAYYSRYFGFRVEFEVDMDSSRKDINAFIIQGSDNIVQYEDLSGGQSQFVTVIIAFALHDIVSKGSKSCNVLVMDEIFEGLSKNNIEKVTEIINSKMGNLSVNLITHRTEFNPYNGRIVNIGFKNGVTYLDI